MSKLHFAVVDDFGKDQKSINGRAICVVTADGRKVFEITLENDGVTMEIRSQGCVKVNGVLYDNKPVVRPVASNVIHVSLSRYEDR